MIVESQLLSSQFAKGTAKKDLVVVRYWFFKYVSNKPAYPSLMLRAGAVRAKA
jgi:hypothetical protein